MKRKSYIQWFDVAMLPVYFGVALSEESYLKEVQKFGGGDPGDWISCGSDATTHLFESDSDWNRIIVCLNGAELKRKNMKEKMLICVHVYQKILASMSNCEFQGSEFAAYTVQWAAECLFDEAVRMKKSGV